MKTLFLTRPLSVPVILGTDIRDDTVHLHAKEILELKNPEGGIHLTCLDGIVWITQPGDSEDHIIRANETLNITKAGLVLVQALPEAIIRW